ncbi:hypothetical protein [Rhodoferax sp. WC2427]|uniref:hypothetical protein n=1 Tax=Rhodoferax sp. WC2427 TaxID=3234144 RepID=UPI003465146A
MRDILVLLETGADGKPTALAQRLRSQWQVVASMPPRLLVLRLPSYKVAAIPGVQPLAQADPPLNEGEQLFAAAWAAQGHKSAPRPGDGADWDAPGFIPPA